MAIVKSYIVYRNINTGQKVPIGEIVERRRADRKDNPGDILHLARKLFSSSTFEALELTVEPAHRDTPVTPGGREER